MIVDTIAQSAVPRIVQARWQEALGTPSIPRWRSLAQMCASMHVNASLYSPDSPLVGTLRTLDEVAHQHMLDMQPVLVEHAA